MEIIKQSRPARLSHFVYAIYLLLPCGDFCRVGGYRNYWRAYDEFNKCVKADKESKYILVGNDCDPVGALF